MLNTILTWGAVKQIKRTTNKYSKENILRKITVRLKALATSDYDPTGKYSKVLSEKSGIKVTSLDLDNWMEGDGDGNSEKFDKAVKKVINKELYRNAESLARLPDVLFYILEPENKKNWKAGGVDIKKLVESQTGTNTSSGKSLTFEQAMKIKFGHPGDTKAWSKVKTFLVTDAPFEEKFKVLDRLYNMNVFDPYSGLSTRKNLSNSVVKVCLRMIEAGEM